MEKKMIKKEKEIVGKIVLEIVGFNFGCEYEQ